jgi:three-Cys-motif partner protein
VAVGAGEQYWDGQNLPSLLKHGILRRYLPIYLARTASRPGKVVVLDAYAGRGVYDDGTLGSAGMMLNWALERKRSTNPADYILRFFEKDNKSYTALAEVVAEHASAGVDVVAERADVITRVDDVVALAAGLPLFLFIDPTGVGLPFEVLVGAMSRPTNARNWPPTEALMNFSWEAVRRIGGLVSSENRNEKAIATLDTALGGDWWQQHFQDGVTDEAVMDVVAGFEARLGEATKAVVLSVPVRRDVTHKPLYSLMFVTRNRRGAWHFGDAAAKSLDEWKNAADEKFGRLAVGQTRADLEAAAIPDLEANILAILAEKGAFTVGDFPTIVFDDHYGEIGETAVRAAIKSLHKKGLTSSDGRGGKTENLKVGPPTQ